MNEARIKELLEQAIMNLFEHQKNIFDFTSQTSQTEWNLGHHYANEVHKFFTDYDCDLDVVKTNFHNRRPDIIFHNRGYNDRNILVIEIKFDETEEVVAEEIQRIRDNWFHPPLSYDFGAVVNLKSNKTGDVIPITNSHT